MSRIGIIASILLLACCSPVSGADGLEVAQDLPPARPAEFEKIVHVVGQGRYMDRPPPCSADQSPAEARCCAPVTPAEILAQEVLRPYAAFRQPGEGHEGLQDCRYFDDNTDIETRVIMLNPRPERVAEWTISACRKARAASLLRCSEWLWENMFSQSGTQFAVTGAVAEDNKGCGDPAPNVGYLFRDGVTVRLEGTDHVCSGDKAWLAGRSSPFLWAHVRWTADPGYARIAMLKPAQYADYFGVAAPKRVAADGAVPWLDTVRNVHLKALTSPSHDWIDAVAVHQLPAGLRSAD